MAESVFAERIVQNLLDTDFREFQTRDGNRIDLYRYSPGISYEVNVSFSF